MTRQYTREEIRIDLLRGISKEMGICETIRCVYDLVHEMPDSPEKLDMTEKLVDALWMAKKMGDRLTYYYETYKDKTGAWGEHLVHQSNDRIRELQGKRGSRI
jgi:hypothetical protein